MCYGEAIGSHVMCSDESFYGIVVLLHGNTTQHFGV